MFVRIHSSNNNICLKTLVLYLIIVWNENKFCSIERGYLTSMNIFLFWSLLDCLWKRLRQSREHPWSERWKLIIITQHNKQLSKPGSQVWQEGIKTKCLFSMNKQVLNTNQNLNIILSFITNSVITNLVISKKSFNSK